MSGLVLVPIAELPRPSRVATVARPTRSIRGLAVVSTVALSTVCISALAYAGYVRAELDRERAAGLATQITIERQGLDAIQDERDLQQAKLEELRAEVEATRSSLESETGPL